MVVLASSVITLDASIAAAAAAAVTQLGREVERSTDQQIGMQLDRYPFGLLRLLVLVFAVSDRKRSPMKSLARARGCGQRCGGERVEWYLCSCQIRDRESSREIPCFMGLLSVQQKFRWSRCDEASTEGDDLVSDNI